MAPWHWRAPPLLAAAILLLIACAAGLAHAGPSSHDGCGLHSADASRLISGLFSAAVVPVGAPDMEAPAARWTQTVDAASGPPSSSLAAPPPDPRGPPSLSLLFA